MIKKIATAILITAALLLLQEYTASATPLGSNLVLGYDGDDLSKWKGNDPSTIMGHWDVTYIHNNEFDLGNVYRFKETIAKRTTGERCQDITLSGLNADIDNYTILLTASAYMFRVFDIDTIEVELQFYDAGNSRIAGGPYVLSNTKFLWQNVSMSFRVPKGTRRIRVILRGTVNSNASLLDFDRIVLTLEKFIAADTTDNDVDHDLEIMFAADPAFTSNITGVSFNGNTLTSNQYTVDTINNNKIILHPGNGDNDYLRTPATGNVIITATGYPDTVISQTITAGAASSLTVTQQPVPGTESGDVFATQPRVTLMDQYNNICQDGPSSSAVVIEAEAKAVTGSWIIGGTTSISCIAGVAAFTDLSCTATAPGNGAITFKSGTITTDSGEFTISPDTVPPTVILSSTAADPTNTSLIPVTITFSEPVSDFTEEDITVRNGTVVAGSLSGGGATYTVNITPAADGAVTVDIASGLAQDALGNTNTAAAMTLSRTYDSQPPTEGTISINAGAAYTNSTAVTLTLSATDAAQMMISEDSGFGGAVYEAYSTGRSFTLSSGDGTKTVYVKYKDAIGNESTAISATITLDTQLPAVFLYSPEPNPTSNSSLPVLIFFDEPVTDFTEEDISVGNGTVAAGSLSGSGATYMVNITPEADGAVTVGIAAGVVQDVAGNTNKAAITLSRTYASRPLTGGPTYTDVSNEMPSSAPTYHAEVNEGDGPGSTLQVTVDYMKGSAGVDISVDSGLISDGKTAVITVPSVLGVDTYTIGLPVPGLATDDAKEVLVFNTDMGSITVMSNMLTGVTGISGDKADITIGEGNRSNLSDDVKAAIGDKPLIQLTLSIDGRQTDWNNPDAPVKVTIPYTPTAEELAHPERIVVWYLDGSGNTVTVPNGRYEPATGTVTFYTTHFSDYAIVYLDQSFDDLKGTEWAREAIEAMTSRVIAYGTGEHTFSPEKEITRGDYIAWLINTLGLTAVYSKSFYDVIPEAPYYETVSIARKLEIVLDSGDNLFHPAEKISRQDMMVFAARALMLYKGLKAADDMTALDQFKDKKEIADYAAGSLAALVMEELELSQGDELKPRSYVTRAEAAVFLYSIYRKYPNAPKATESKTATGLPYPITVPGDLKAVSAGYNKVKLTWSKVAGATEYVIYRANSKEGTYSKLKETTLTSYTDTKLTTDQTYYYQVRACRLADDAKGYTDYSVAVSAKPVLAKASFKVEKASSSGTKLTWNKIVGATGYEIHRTTNSNGKYSKLAETKSTSYTDKKLTTGKTYYYKVRAYRLVGGTKVYSSFSKVKYVKL